MMNEKQVEAALRQAREALDGLYLPGELERVNKAIIALREALAEQPHCDDCGGFDPECPLAQPAQQQKEGFASPGGGYVPAIPRPMPLDWKLVPRKATPEMLKAMDECAQEGYDERLYAGMASSVYMAAWDASPVMGTLPEQPAQQQEPIAKVCHDLDGHIGWNPKLTQLPDEGTSLYISSQPSKPLTDEQRKAIVVCFTSGKVSVSEVQRKLAISYNEAQQLCQSIVDLKLAQGLQLAPSLDRHGIKGDA